MTATLTLNNHDRDRIGLTYVYPVLSRRSGGLSVGLNLNPNNACNWRCVYCQVPNLQRGSAPAIDLNRLEQELRGFLAEVLDGEFYARFAVPPPLQHLRDIALSGNGEPTSAAEFAQVVDLIGRVKADFALACKLVLISNGSLMRRQRVRQGLRRFAELGGEVWFKLDSASADGSQRINGVRQSPVTALRNLRSAAECAPTWLQTCVFAYDGSAPSHGEQQAYLALLRQAQVQGIALCGVLLYGLARPSMQTEAPRLAALPAAWLQDFAAEIEATGLTVKISV